MKKEKKNDVAALLQYAGSRRKLTFLGLIYAFEYGAVYLYLAGCA